MPIDRRTFLLGSGVAAAGGALASFGVVAAVAQQAGPEPAAAATPMAPIAAAPSFELRILGWDRSDDRGAFAASPAGDAARWVAIDRQWRGAWR